MSLIVRVPLQSLGMQVMGVPGLKRLRGRSRGSAGNHQEQRSSSADAERDAQHAVSDQDLDRAIVPFEESEPRQQEDVAAVGVERYAGDMEIIFNPDKVSLAPLPGHRVPLCMPAKPAIRASVESQCRCSETGLFELTALR